MNDAAERQVALEGVGGFKTPPTVTLLMLHQRRNFDAHIELVKLGVPMPNTVALVHFGLASAF